MHQECRERFPRHRLQWKLLVSDPGMHHGTCVTHVPWCMPRTLTRGGGENVPGIPGACATRNFMYLARGPCLCFKSENKCFCQIHDQNPSHFIYSYMRLLKYSKCFSTISLFKTTAYVRNALQIDPSLAEILWLWDCISEQQPWISISRHTVFMKTSSNGNIFLVTGRLCSEFTGPRLIPLTGQWRGALMFSLICARRNG